MIACHLIELSRLSSAHEAKSSLDTKARRNDVHLGDCRYQEEKFEARLGCCISIGLLENEREGGVRSVLALNQAELGLSGGSQPWPYLPLEAMRRSVRRRKEFNEPVDTTKQYK